MTDLISFVQSTAQSGSNAAASQATLTENFDTFLTLLTSQMQNQDPLEPLDSSEFTNQLVQFSGVEQQIETNRSLEQLISANKASAGASLSGYLGQQVEIGSSGAGFHGDPVTWRYRLQNDAAEATLTIKDKLGAVVWTQDAEKTSGSHDFTWDGSTLNGGTASPDEVYYAEITAQTVDEQDIATGVSVLTKVTGLDLSYGDPALETSAGIFSYTDILRVTQS